MNDDMKRMTEAKIPPLVLSLAVPTVISMLITSVYNMADTYFVSQLGTGASGAVGVVFPLMAAIQAVGFTLGMGAGSIISRLLGAGDEDNASKFASGALFFGIAAGIALAAWASMSIEKLMRLFGSTETILPYAISYARYIIFGAPIMIGSFVMNNLLRSQGRARYAMLGIAAGGILNVALDPIFIFGLNMGTAGAAAATLLSQCVSFIILLTLSLGRKSAVKIRPRLIPRGPGDYISIIVTGLPSFARQGLASAASMLLNNQARVYGDAAVAAMGIVAKIFMIIFAVVLGIGQGFQPVVGINYGAKKYDRVKKAFYFTLAFGGAVMIIMSAAVYGFADRLMAQFTKGDMQVIEIGRTALRAQCIAAPAIAVSTVCNMSFQMTGKSWTATLLACARQGIFFIPLILLLPRMWQITGVQLAQPAADILSAIFAVPFGISFLRSLKED